MSTPLARLQLLNAMQPSITFRFGRVGTLTCITPEKNQITVEADTDQLAFARMTEELEEAGILPKQERVA